MELLGTLSTTVGGSHQPKPPRQVSDKPGEGGFAPLAHCSSSPGVCECRGKGTGWVEEAEERGPRSPHGGLAGTSVLVSEWLVFRSQGRQHMPPRTWPTEPNVASAPRVPQLSKSHSSLILPGA